MVGGAIFASGCAIRGVTAELPDLLGCHTNAAAVGMPVPLVQAAALPLMRLAEKAAGPGGFRAFALEMHGHDLRIFQVRQPGDRL